MSLENPRAVMVGVQLPNVSDAEHESSLTELARLAKTLGLEVIGRVSQRRARLSRAAVVGRGKLKVIARYTGGPGYIPSPVPSKDRKNLYVRGNDGSAQREGEGGAEEDAEETPGASETGTDLEGGDGGSPEDEEGGDDEEATDGPARTLPLEARAAYVLLDHEVSPSEARNLERATGAKVLDRTAVILAIFERHARSREAKLEVEIARLAYMAPRLREVPSGGDRQRGGVGGRGAGESSGELERRKVRDRIAELRRELAAIERTARTRRARRAEQSTVALVGYTNAGKSSLMRALTGSEVYVADKLFATLDTTVRILRPETRPRILVSDTVGFIKKLPHGLVASFRATLDAAAEAQLLLHVIDAADPAFRTQMEVTRELLGEIGANEAPTLLVLNKADRLDAPRRAALQAEFPGAALMSAHDPGDVARLHERIVAFFEQQMVDGELIVPYPRQALVGDIHESCRVLEETYDESGATLRVRAEPRVLERLRLALARAAE